MGFSRICDLSVIGALLEACRGLNMVFALWKRASGERVNRVIMLDEVGLF